MSSSEVNKVEESCVYADQCSIEGKKCKGIECSKYIKDEYANTSKKIKLKKKERYGIWS